jgi:hypothetical protein
MKKFFIFAQNPLMKTITNKPAGVPATRPRYNEKELILFATSQRGRNVKEYGPIVSGKLNDNKLLVSDYEAYMRKNK